jgi:hypothetical protein
LALLIWMVNILTTMLNNNGDKGPPVSTLS